MPQDPYLAAADRLLAMLAEFELAALDDAVGDDQEQIKRERMAEILREEFPPPR